MVVLRDVRSVYVLGDVSSWTSKKSKFDPVTLRVSHEFWHAVIFLLIDAFSKTISYGVICGRAGMGAYYPKEFGASKYKTSYTTGDL